MPWQEQRTLNLRHQFVLQALAPDANVSALCREHGISRKTGYKWIKRFQEHGVEGLTDMSRRPHASPLRASGEMVLKVIELRGSHPSWGPKKLHEVLSRTVRADDLPSVRTIARILSRADLVLRRRRRPTPSERPKDAPNIVVEGPNDLWTIDFKGWWRTRDGQRAEPLTVRDDHSRFVLASRLMKSTSTDAVQVVFQELFERHGLPQVMLMDNGSPFASTRGRAGLTRLSAWFVSLGIQIVRSRPGHPQDNGGHERMHRDVATEVELFAQDDITSQQAALDLWRTEFNHVRPHEALEMDVPADHYRPSSRRFRGPRHPPCPAGWTQRRVNKAGYVKFNGRSFYLSLALCGNLVAVQANDEGEVHAKFFDVDLGVLGEAA